MACLLAVAAGCRPAPAPVAAPAEVHGFPRELVRFTPRGTAPVFQGGGPGAWDEKIRERGWVLREGDTYKLWYTGYDGTPTGRRRLGYATSPDGLTWARHPGNPLVPDVWVEDVQVVRDGGRYLMFAEGEGDRAHLLTSPDGVQWTPSGRLDVRLANNTPIPDGPFGTPAVLRDNNKWHLFYERGDRGVWLATSDDLKVWRNVRDDPVLSPGPGEYDRDMVAVNQVLKRGGRYYAYYHGCATTGPDAKKWSCAVASSDDLLTWAKYPGNPLLPAGENKSSGTLVDTGAGERFYTTHPAVFAYAVGE